MRASSTARAMRLRSALLLSLALLAGCAPRAAVAPPSAVAAAPAPVYPGAEWERIADPASVGWSAAALDSVRARLATLPSTGFVAVVGGRVLMEYGDTKALSYLASVRKSILSMLYGNYVARGVVRLDRTVGELGLDDVGGLSAQEKEATVRDLLTARSGVFHAASNAGDDLASAPPRNSVRHGSYQLYSNWDFNAAGAAFERMTGRDIYDALESDLARPLGFQDWDHAAQRKSGDTTRSRYLAYHMYLSTRDMARVGYLMLREGRWNGAQVVPRDWVRETTRAFTPVSEMNPPRRRQGPFGYGYLWWVWDGAAAAGPYAGAYTGLGAVGQHITVMPALDLVVAHKTRPGDHGGVSHDAYRELLDLLVRGRRAR
jgi:CubicO group peptidase (beta-lactamase class C family)